MQKTSFESAIFSQVIHIFFSSDQSFFLKPEFSVSLGGREPLPFPAGVVARLAFGFLVISGLSGRQVPHVRAPFIAG